MEKRRLKARMYGGILDDQTIELLHKNNLYLCLMWGAAKKFPELAKQIKAADGKCVDIQISMEVV